MKILLDENFPLALVRRLRESGRDAEHLIELDQRGTPDAAILKKLDAEELLFLTQDQEFLNLRSTRAPVIVSHVSQSLRIAERVEIWLRAIERYFARQWREKLFEVFDDGELHPWVEHPDGSRSARARPIAGRQKPKR